MSDVTVRLWIVGAVVVGVLAVAAFARRGASLRRRAPLPGLAPGLHLFVSDTCPTCERLVQVVSSVAGDGGYRRVSWESEPEIFRKMGIERVPLTVLARPGGGGWSAAGVPSERRLRRWLGDP
jgi:hypothetical protein